MNISNVNISSSYLNAPSIPPFFVNPPILPLIERTSSVFQHQAGSQTTKEMEKFLKNSSFYVDAAVTYKHIKPILAFENYAWGLEDQIQKKKADYSELSNTEKQKQMLDSMFYSTLVEKKGLCMGKAICMLREMLHGREIDECPELQYQLFGNDILQIQSILYHKSKVFSPFEEPSYLLSESQTPIVDHTPIPEVFATTPSLVEFIEESTKGKFLAHVMVSAKGAYISETGKKLTDVFMKYKQSGQDVSVLIMPRRKMGHVNVIKLPSNLYYDSDIPKVTGKKSEKLSFSSLEELVTPYILVTHGLQLSFFEDQVKKMINDASMELQKKSKFKTKKAKESSPQDILKQIVVIRKRTQSSEDAIIQAALEKPTISSMSDLEAFLKKHIKKVSWFDNVEGADYHLLFFIKQQDSPKLDSQKEEL